MKKSLLDKVTAEAFRFLSVAKDLEKRGSDAAGYYSSSKHTGAVKRASMDLTRALADLRRRGS